MTFDEYTACDAHDLRALLSTGELTAEEVEAAAREALTRANALVNGLADPLFEAPLTSDPSGPLAGVPFVIKDIGPMAKGVPFYCGSRGVPGIRPDHDSNVMRRIRAAGLMTLGLTTMPEFGLNFVTESKRTGSTLNPHDPSSNAGGSSGGSAALVAAGGVPMAHGSDGAGSLRIPAACCRLFALKPTRGRISPGPDAAEPLFGLTVPGGLTRSLRDTAALLDALQGAFPGDKYTAPPRVRPYVEELGVAPGRLRVACWDHPGLDGHDNVDVTPPIDHEAVERILRAGKIDAVRVLFMGPRLPPPHLLEDTTNAFLEDARRMTALELLDILDAQNRVSRTLGAFFAPFDLLVSPTLAGSTPRSSTSRASRP
jgi:amidase